jgi:NAD-dependent aldehyde dehydrogenases
LGKFDAKDQNLITTKVLLNVTSDMEVMKKEIFGPILPILSYENLEEVVNYINAHDRPLGLYFFGHRKKDHQYIIKNTRSGGVTFNDALFHLLQSRLPFGGVGESGYGCYHGFEGFLNFSNLKSIYYQTSHDIFLSVVRPPRGKYFKLVSRIMNKLS